MAGKRTETMDIRQLINLKKQGLSNRKIARLLQLSRNTVNQYIQAFGLSGLSYDELLAMDDLALKEWYAPQSEVSTGRYEDLAGRFDFIFSELKKPGCTLLALWREYHEKTPKGYGYTQFTRHYNLWADQKQVSGKLEHKAGEKLFIDYTGKKLSIVDRHTGQVRAVEVFVAILPCSQYTYVEASVSQQRDELIGSMRRCLEYFGGAPLAIVSDGLKSAVTKACKYEPVINKAFKDFALHYGCAVDPARPYSPQDKALVEGAVKLVYQRIFYPLGKMTFFSISELNEAIGELLAKHNNCVFQLAHYSRRELFLSTEKPFLKPLAPTAYELRHYRSAKVQKMGYVYLSEDKHYYSVPYRFIGEQVEVRYTNSVVEIFHNGERLCTHKRDKQAGKYSTQKEHMSSTHRAYSEWSLPYFQRKAELIGPQTAKYITRLIQQHAYPETGYKQAMGIVQLVKVYEKKRIETACERALVLAYCAFSTIDNMLRKGTDLLELPLQTGNHIPNHGNIRGAGHYQ